MLSKIANIFKFIKLKNEKFFLTFSMIFFFMLVIFTLIFYLIYFKSVKRHEKTFISQQSFYISSTLKSIEDRIYTSILEQKYLSEVSLPGYEKRIISEKSLKKIFASEMEALNETLFFVYFQKNQKKVFSNGSGKVPAESDILRVVEEYKRFYFNENLQFNRVNYISEFYLKNHHQALITYMPVVSHNRLKGVFCSVIDLKAIINKHIQQLNFDNNKILVFTDSGHIVWNSYNNLAGKNIMNDSLFPGVKNVLPEVFRKKTSNSEYVYIDEKSGETVRKLICWSSFKVGDKRIIISSDISDTEVNRDIAELKFSLLVLALAFALALIFSSIMLIKSRNKILEESKRELEMQVYLRTEELVMKETLYQTIFESANDGIILQKKDKFMDSNHRAAAILGFEKNELLKLSLKELSPELQQDNKNSVEDIRQRVDKTLNGESQFFEWVLKNSEGKLIDVEISLKNIVLSESDYIMIIIRDITARNMASRELENTKNYLKQVLNSLSIVLISLNKDGIITQWNQAAEKYFHIKEDTVMYKSLWDIIPFFEKYKTNVFKVINKNRPEFLIKEVVDFRGKKNFNISIQPLQFDKDSGVVISLDDITELEKKEEQLHQAQKMETVGNLAGGLAHDFNNVLGGIIGTVSLIDFNFKYIKNLNLSKLKKQIKTIGDSANRAADMVKQLLSLTRKHELSFKFIDLNRSIKNVLKICENTFDKRIALGARYAERQAIVNADPTKIEQVLLNLCVNASHAMTFMRTDHRGYGGTLDIAIDRVFPDDEFLNSFATAEKINYWKVAVSDTGVGIDDDTLEKIFDPFFTTKEKGQGTGLGLAMVYNIINQHKGFINVDSTIGKGTLFEFYIPVVEISEIKDDDAEGEYRFAYYGTGQILVVDDEEIMRSTAFDILTTCGYEVVLVKSGQEAIDYYKNEYDSISAVLLDMAMPGLSGKETYLELKKINNDVKVVLVSGFKQDERVKEVMTLGINAFIQKPYSLSHLSSVFKDLLSNHASHDGNNTPI